MKSRAISLALTVALLSSLADVRAAGVSSSEAKKYRTSVRELLSQENERALYRLIKEITLLDSPKVATLIPVAAATLESLKLHKRGVAAIQHLKNPKAVEKLVKLLENKKVPFRQKALILQGFARREDDVSLKAIVDAVESPFHQVQLATVRAMRKRRHRDAIPALVELLKKTIPLRNRTWYETRVALVDLTGQDYQDIKDWRKYVKGLPPNFDPRELRKTKGGSSVKLKTAKEFQRETVNFFGKEILSDRIVFVIDVSGSMYMYDPDDEYEGRNEVRDRQRLRRAKAQLAQAIQSLPRRARFNVISFSTKINTWKGSLEYATPKNVQSALKFVGQLRPNGATATGDALKAAFSYESADTVILLTDGAPTNQLGTRRRGPSSNKLVDDILTWVKQANAGRHIKIETFGFRGIGEYPPEVSDKVPPVTKPQMEFFLNFLRTLAKRTGGRFHAID